MARGLRADHGPRLHPISPAVTDAALTRNYEDGPLYATASLVTDRPTSLPKGLHSWWGRPEELGNFYMPEGRDLAKRSFAVTATKLMFLVPVAGLPVPPSDLMPSLRRS
ncbi:hypothetical protein [Nonomuraea recticatena]|uniref:Uncharacterized protein n=1 Tax=Nonomuraea recticatena TaxID=46178 RepID=A0ABP6FTS5_9ACTN